MQPDPNLPSGHTAAGQRLNDCLVGYNQKMVDATVRTGSSYLARSSLRDDPVGIFSGILQSHGRKKLP